MQPHDDDSSKFLAHHFQSHRQQHDAGKLGMWIFLLTEILLFGVRGKNARTLKPGRTQVNLLATRKREHSRKPDEIFDIIEACSPGPRLEMFCRGVRKDWTVWGNQADESYAPTWDTYANHSQAELQAAEVQAAE